MRIEDEPTIGQTAIIAALFALPAVSRQLEGVGMCLASISVLIFGLGSGWEMGDGRCQRPDGVFESCFSVSPLLTVASSALHSDYNVSKEPTTNYIIINGDAAMLERQLIAGYHKGGQEIILWSLNV